MQNNTNTGKTRRASGFNPSCKKLHAPTGRRSGEDAVGAAKAKITNSDAELIRQLHEEFPRGDKRHMGYAKLSAKFGISKRSVQRVCLYLSYTG